MKSVIKLHLLLHFQENVEWHGVGTTTTALEHFHLKLKEAFGDSNKQIRDDSSIKQVLGEVCHRPK